MVSSAQPGRRETELSAPAAEYAVSGVFGWGACQKYCMKETVLPEFR